MYIVIRRWSFCFSTIIITSMNNGCHFTVVTFIRVLLIWGKHNVITSHSPFDLFKWMIYNIFRTEDTVMNKRRCFVYRKFRKFCVLYYSDCWTTEIWEINHCDFKKHCIQIMLSKNNLLFLQNIYRHNFWHWYEKQCIQMIPSEHFWKTYPITIFPVMKMIVKYFVCTVPQWDSNRGYQKLKNWHQ